MSPPLYAHQYVLGADVGASDTRVDVHATGASTAVTRQEIRYIAAWARRNLFDGAKPGEPTPAGRCPECGEPGGGDAALAPGQRWCSTDGCRVVTFLEEPR